ncbi:MAG: hypothetical protein NTW14_11755 [bacterium]|nr:hypothetical protein [bacterium]
MSTLSSQILETWRIHQRITLLFLENVPEEGFKATLSQRGGRDVARQMAHVHNVRVVRLTSFSKKIGNPVKEFAADYSPTKTELLEAFRQTGEVMEKYIEKCIENDGVVPNFQRGVVPMIGYYISHEDHHRGHALLTMKQCGVKLPDALKMSIWEWNKI